MPTIPPVKSLSLFRSGVAHVSRQGAATGSFQIPMPADAVNDVLTSLSTRGMVAGVSFLTPRGRTEEVGRRGFSLGNTNILVGLATSKLRGQEVAVSRSRTLASTVTGRVLGVDGDSTDTEGAEEPFLVIQESEGGILRVAFSDIEKITPTDPEVLKDFQFWTESLRAQDGVQSLLVQVKGPGEVGVAYLTPSPVWRSTYDIVVEGSKATLTPSAVAFNPLTEALEGVTLTLATGSPVSFRTTLDRPQHPDRQILAEDLSVEAPQEYRVASARPKAMRARSASRGLESLQEDGEPESMMYESAMGGAPVLAAVAMAAPPMRSETQAEVGDSGTGAETEFVVKNVSMPPSGAITIPLTRCDLPAKVVRVWRQGTHPDQALQITNGTFVLERGPVSITVDGKFVGQAVIPATPRGKEILLGFARDRSITVTPMGNTTDTASNRFGGPSRDNVGYFVQNTSRVTTAKFAIASLHDEEVELVMDIPAYGDSEPKLPDGVTAQKVGGQWRLTLTLAPNSERDLRVSFTSNQQNFVSARNLSRSVLKTWDPDSITADQKESLEQILTHMETLNLAQQAVNGLSVQLQNEERREKDIITKLKDMKDVDGAEKARTRFQKDLDTVGDSISKIRDDLAKAQDALKSATEIWDGVVARMSQTA